MKFTREELQDESYTTLRRIYKYLYPDGTFRRKVDIVNAILAYNVLGQNAPDEEVPMSVRIRRIRDV